MFFSKLTTILSVAQIKTGYGSKTLSGMLGVFTFRAPVSLS
jgi:hypothetical protein